MDIEVAALELLLIRSLFFRVLYTHYTYTPLCACEVILWRGSLVWCFYPLSAQCMCICMLLKKKGIKNKIIYLQYIADKHVITTNNM